ncbi:hypothetical protein [Scytonema sp. NUACC21]
MQNLCSSQEADGKYTEDNRQFLGHPTPSPPPIHLYSTLDG